ncbi:cobalamin biosynthesis protein CbiM (plasmid) [Mesorhizobium sp. ANAO-SY3R2]
MCTQAIAIVATIACLTFAAEAHRLKLFATVEDGVVMGYGFFIGGGRPSGAQLLIRNKAGVELYRGPTGRDGSFTFKPAAASDLFLTINAGDGHVADTHIAADRFPEGGTLDAVGVAQAAGEAPAATLDPVAPTFVPAAAKSPEELAALVDRSVDRAVSRQIAPLLEAYAEADGRARFTDVVSGIAMIIGLAGLLMWARSRRRPGEVPPAQRNQP